MNRLQEYIEDRIRALGDSRAQVASRADLSRQRLNDLLSPGRQRIPETEVLDRLAVALQVPRKVLRRLAAESYGYVVTEADERTSATVASLEELPEGRRRDIDQMVQLYLREAREQEQRTSPTSPPTRRGP
jgi:transcriptional regulator with XRE-family HTH domain